MLSGCVCGCELHAGTISSASSAPHQQIFVSRCRVFPFHHTATFYKCYSTGRQSYYLKPSERHLVIYAVDGKDLPDKMARLKAPELIVRLCSLTTEKNV